MVFQSDPMNFISWYNPSQALTEKHVSYPQLTATPAIFEGQSQLYGGPDPPLK